MSPCMLFLLLGSILCFAKHVPRSSLFSDSEVLPYQSHRDIPSDHNAHHQSRRLDEIDSYRRHRYYGITVRNGHDHDYGWREINQTGTRSVVSDVDDITFDRINLTDWSFRFFGHLHNELYISANGFVTVMQDYAEGPCGAAFCEWNGHYYTRYIAPLMTDWNPKGNKNSQIFYQMGFDNLTQEHHLIVEWENMILWSQNDTLNETYFSFQTIIEEDGDIIFNYQSLPFDPSIRSIGKDQFGTELKYPVNIGLEDAFIYRSKDRYPELDGSLWTYYPLRLNWNNITHSLGRSIQIEAFPTCQQFTTCYTCTEYTLTHKDDPEALECAFCGAIDVCSDAIGREVASEADVCMVATNQMQTSYEQCRMFDATSCGSENTTLIGFWPVTDPVSTANRACSLSTRVNQNCRGYVCYEQRLCNYFGEWQDVTVICDRNETLTPCVLDGVWEPTLRGNISTVSCEGAEGRMVRTCNFYGQWSAIDSTACIAASLGGGQIIGITLGSIIAAIIICLLCWKANKQRGDLREFTMLDNPVDETEMSFPQANQ